MKNKADTANSRAMRELSQRYPDEFKQLQTKHRAALGLPPAGLGGTPAPPLNYDDPTDPRHGRYSSYTRGCRCEKCRAAQRAYRAARYSQTGK